MAKKCESWVKIFEFLKITSGDPHLMSLMYKNCFQFKIQPHLEWLKTIGLGVNFFEFLKMTPGDPFDEFDVEKYFSM